MLVLILRKLCNNLVCNEQKEEYDQSDEEDGCDDLLCILHFCFISLCGKISESAIDKSEHHTRTEDISCDPCSIDDEILYLCAEVLLLCDEEYEVYDLYQYKSYYDIDDTGSCCLNFRFFLQGSHELESIVYHHDYRIEECSSLQER